MAEKGLGGRVNRASKLARIGLTGASGFARSNARKFLGGDPDDVSAHELSAERIANVLGEMKGAAMKVGQLLSLVDMDLPPEIRST